VAPPLKFLSLPALAVLLAVTGCGGDNFAQSAETDDSAYREGQQLEKQGRNQEALASYLKVITKRGDAAPESHLEAGLIYLEHDGDPIAAIYHFRKYLELEPNSRQASEVRGLIDTAKLNFARTLPARPLDNPDPRLVESDERERLRHENDELKAELATARGGGTPPADGEVVWHGLPAPEPDDHGLQAHATNAPAAAAPADDQAAAPITPAPLPPDGGEAASASSSVPPSGTTTDRTHTVVKGDTLFNLAQRYYGTRSKAKVRAIVAANRDQLSSESAPLRIGMALKIP